LSLLHYDNSRSNAHHEVPFDGDILHDDPNLMPHQALVVGDKNNISGLY